MYSSTSRYLATFVSLADDPVHDVRDAAVLGERGLLQLDSVRKLLYPR
jgi:hypothetical protein